ncbi:MAG: membrane protein insertion efficiency factor YidD [Actinomycetes bacterium]
MTRSFAGSRRSPVGRALLAAIGFYSRAVSPALPARCRFHPTCSAYAAAAIEVHGVARGSWLALVRLAKCAPWHPGGLDPVPGTGGARDSSNDPVASEAPVLPDHRSARPTPPAVRRAGQEESSVV